MFISLNLILTFDLYSHYNIPLICFLWREMVMFFFCSIFYQISVNTSSNCNNNAFCIFVVQLSLGVYNFVTGNHWVVQNTCEIFTIVATTCSRIPNIIFFTYVFCTHINICRCSTFDLNSTFAFPFSWHMLCYCFWVIPVIMFNTFRFKSSVLFLTHTLLDKSLIILQLPTHISKLIISG